MTGVLAAIRRGGGCSLLSGGVLARSPKANEAVGGFLDAIPRRTGGPRAATVADFNGDRAADLLLVDSGGILVSFANP